MYLLELENGAWYTGISTDPRRRFQDHVSGKGAKSMRLSKPKRLISLEFVGTYAQALRREAQIKGLSRRKKEAYSSDPGILPQPASDAPWRRGGPMARPKKKAPGPKTLIPVV